MSNMPNKRTMEFDVTDAPMLMHAMSIAACTAMMCGHPDAKKRFDQFKAFFKSMVPPEANLFEEEVWGEIGMALATAKTFKVHLEESAADRRARAEGRTPWRPTYDLYCTVGDKTWRRKFAVKDFEPGDPAVKAVFDVLTSLAPIDCVGEMDDKTVVDPVT